MLKTIWNTWWNQWTWPLKLATVIAVLIAFGLIFGALKSCGPKPKLNEAEIQRGEQAVKERNDAELKRILVESDVREKQIDANTANAEREAGKAIQESRERYANMNTSDLAAELEKRK